MKFRFDPLPKGFVLAKPIKWDKYDESAIYELEAKGQLIITVKRNGYKFFEAISGNKVKVYTDGINEISNRVGHVVAELKKKNVPNDTLIASEGLIVQNGLDYRGGVTKLLQSNQTKIAELEMNLGLLKIMIFEIVYWKSKLLLALPYSERLNIIQNEFSGCEYVAPVEVLNLSYDQAKIFVVKHDCEGLVLYDKNFRSSFRLDGGEAERIIGCYKWKPLKEDDFVAVDWVTSEKVHGQLKDVRLAQYDPKTGELFDCGNFGGFDNKTRELLKKMDYPFVIQLQFENRYESGKLENPRFMEIRDDKKSEHCIAPRHFKKAVPLKNLKPRA